MAKTKAKFGIGDVVQIDGSHCIAKGMIGSIVGVDDEDDGMPNIYLIKGCLTGQIATAYEGDITLIKSAPKPPFTQDELKIIRTAMIELIDSNTGGVKPNKEAMDAIYAKLNTLIKE